MPFIRSRFVRIASLLGVAVILSGCSQPFGFLGTVQDGFGRISAQIELPAGLSISDISDGVVRVVGQAAQTVGDIVSRRGELVLDVDMSVSGSRDRSNPIGRVTHKFEVPTMETGRSDEPLDLRTLKLDAVDVESLLDSTEVARAGS